MTGPTPGATAWVLRVDPDGTGAVFRLDGYTVQEARAHLRAHLNIDGSDAPVSTATGAIYTVHAAEPSDWAIYKKGHRRD